ncbi:MAG TPA: glycosyl hydrolase family 28-related protein, partial [bacterium]|nr:glycosyl hydrolase family 28-related protein [bacterium]
MLPAPMNVVAPVPPPNLPSYDDAFTPPTSTAAPVAGAPTFAEWIRQAGPGDSILFTGDKLAAFTLYGQTSGPGSLLSAVPLYQDSLQSQVTLPSCLPPNSTYLVWSSNASGASAPAVINGTELWWGNDTALPGDTVSVFGRNFYYGGVTPTVYVQAPGQAGAVAQLGAYNNYRIDYVMPAAVAALGSTVQVWVHNGHGGAYGWSGPVSVALQATANDDSYWSGATFNVQAYGAVGDGATDDGPAIAEALNAAAASAVATGKPATVYLPGSSAGTVYLSNRGFNNLANVRWMGDGKTQTILRLGPGFAAGDGSYDNAALFYETSGMAGHGDHVEIRDMTLDINNNLQGANAAAGNYNLMLETSVNDFKLSNLAVYSGEPLATAIP